MRYVLWLALLCGTLAPAIGCHDGPLYALKSANPYFRHQWSADEELGPTDASRAAQLELLAERLPQMTADEHAKWAGHLRMLLENDPSSQMRLLTMRAAATMHEPHATELLEMGLADEHPKVRMITCEMLGRRPSASAARMLAETAGSDTDEDVRMAAIRSLANHQGPVVTTTLRSALETNDPAMQMAAMAALRRSTGVSIGDDAEAWLAHLDGKPLPETERPSIASRIRDLF